MNQKKLFIAIFIILAVSIVAYFVLTKKGEPVIQQTLTSILPQTQPLTAQPPTSTPTDEIEKWKTYHNEKYRFEVRYPDEWFLTEDTNDAQRPRIIFSNKLSRHYALTAVTIYPKGARFGIHPSSEESIDEMGKIGGMPVNIRKNLDKYLDEDTEFFREIYFEDAPSVFKTWHPSGETTDLLITVLYEYREFSEDEICKISTKAQDCFLPEEITSLRLGFRARKDIANQIISTLKFLK